MQAAALSELLLDSRRAAPHDPLGHFRRRFGARAARLLDELAGVPPRRARAAG